MSELAGGCLAAHTGWLMPWYTSVVEVLQYLKVYFICLQQRSGHSRHTVRIRQTNNSQDSTTICYSCKCTQISINFIF